MIGSGVVLDALGDPTRRRVLELVRDSGPAPVGAIAEAMPVSGRRSRSTSACSRAPGLVTCAKQGTRHLYAVQPDGLAVLRLWLDGFWDDALLRFKRAAEGSEGE